MRNPPCHAPVRAPINLTLPWHVLSVEIHVAKHNHNIVTDKLSKSKKLNPAIPWGNGDYFSVTGYYTHPLESYTPKP